MLEYVHFQSTTWDYMKIGGVRQSAHHAIIFAQSPGYGKRDTARWSP